MKREKAEELPRPNIRIEVKCRVVLRQLGEMFVDEVIRNNRYIPRDHRKRSLGRLLAEKLEQLRQLQQEEGAPQLDHDPQLEQRTKIRDRAGKIIEYDPPANDPEHLFYRWDHAIKTNVRGDHGQYSDVVIRKRGRRRRREPYVSPLGLKGKKPRVASAPRAKARPPKRKWAKGRKIESAGFRKGGSRARSGRI